VGRVGDGVQIGADSVRWPGSGERAEPWIAERSFAARPRGGPSHSIAHFESDADPESGGSGLAGRIDSASLTAHWGWMPEREYTAFLQTGQTGRVEIGMCQCF
jgi:hypothetical protein